jgi:hypothetical protein
MLLGHIRGYKENIVESDIEHHNPNPYNKWGLHLHKRLITCLPYYLPPVDHYYITISTTKGYKRNNNDS